MEVTCQWLLPSALFLVIGQGYSYLSILPEELRAVPGGAATFNCFLVSSSSNIIEIKWIVNGSLLEEQTLMGVTSKFNPEFGGGLGTLQFRDLPITYNMTRIQCRAELSRPQATSTSDYATLIILKYFLPAVDNLIARAQDSIIHLKWTLPSTVASNDNITYCVDVINSIDITIETECGLVETEFKFVLPPQSWCEQYFFTVTPIGATSNGTKKQVPYSANITLPQVMDEPISLTDTTRILFMSAPVCDVTLTLVDLDIGDIITLRGADITIVENNITFTTESLPSNHSYNITVRATNIAGSATSYTSIDTNINMFTVTQSAELHSNGSLPQTNKFGLAKSLVLSVALFIVLIPVIITVVMNAVHVKREKEKRSETEAITRMKSVEHFHYRHQ